MRRVLGSLLLAATSLAGLLSLPACEPPGLTVQTIVSGLTIPWDLGFTPDGTMIFTERPGRISALVDGQVRLLADPPDVVQASEAGMMGLAVDPEFATNRFIYACLASTRGGPNNDVRVARWRVNSDYTGLTNRRDIITGMPVNASGQLGRHSGCRPRWGPAGHWMYVGTGDAAIGTVPQDPQSLGGKVLRVGRNGSGHPDNPGGPFRQRIYTYGHRNVQGIAFRPGSGDVYEVEHGSFRDDEVNRLIRGGNYGWDPVPGYNESVPMTDTNKFPNARRAIWSSGNPTIATSGTTFLSGSRWGSWDGALAVAVLKDEHLRIFVLNDAGNQVVAEHVVLTNQGRLRTPVQGPGGNLFVTTANGGGTDKILRLIPSS